MPDDDRAVNALRAALHQTLDGAPVPPLRLPATVTPLRRDRRRWLIPVAVAGVAAAIIAAVAIPGALRPSPEPTRAIPADAPSSTTPTPVAPVDPTVSGHLTLPQGAKASDYRIIVNTHEYFDGCRDAKGSAGDGGGACAVAPIQDDGYFETQVLASAGPVPNVVYLAVQDAFGNYAVSTIGSTTRWLHDIEQPFTSIDITLAGPTVPLTFTMPGPAFPDVECTNIVEGPDGTTTSVPRPGKGTKDSCRKETEWGVRVRYSTCPGDVGDWGDLGDILNDYPRVTAKGSSVTIPTYPGLCRIATFYPPGAHWVTASPWATTFPDANGETDSDWATLVDGDPNSQGRTHYLPADMTAAAITLAPKTKHISGKLTATKSVAGLTVLVYGQTAHPDLLKSCPYFRTPDGNDCWQVTWAEGAVAADGTFDVSLYEGLGPYRLQILANGRYLPGSIDGGASPSYEIDLTGQPLTDLTVRVADPTVHYVVTLTDPAHAPDGDYVLCYAEQGSACSTPNWSWWGPEIDRGLDRILLPYGTGRVPLHNGRFEFDGYLGKDVTIQIKNTQEADGRTVFVVSGEHRDTLTISPSQPRVAVQTAHESD